MEDCQEAGAEGAGYYRVRKVVVETSEIDYLIANRQVIVLETMGTDTTGRDLFKT